MGRDISSGLGMWHYPFQSWESQGADATIEKEQRRQDGEEKAGAISTGPDAIRGHIPGKQDWVGSVISIYSPLKGY